MLKLNLFFHFTCGGHPDEIAESHGELREPPRPRKVPRPHLLEQVHPQRVHVATISKAVEPGEQDVAVIPLDGREGEDGQGGEHAGGLNQVLAGDAALAAVVDHDEAEGQGARHPRQADVDDEGEHLRGGQAFFQGQGGLEKDDTV